MLVDKVALLGVNHRTAPVEVREKLAFLGDCATPLAEIKTLPECDECHFLSTCNRVEALFVETEPEKAVRAVRDFLFAGSGLSAQEADKYSYLHRGGDAVRHFFRVASSLDSMVVGEPQILGQLKEAYRAAAAHKSTGVVLNRLLHKSFSVAKRIRTETNIGGNAVSISYAAVQLAKKILGDLQGKKVLLVGAGEMAELAAEHLVAQGIGRVVVANRTLERATRLARCFNGMAVGLNELVPQLEEVDILISSTGAPGLVLHKEEVRPIMRQRHNRPLFLIDIAVPRDLDQGLNDLDNVYLYDIDDLKQVVDINKEERRKEADRAERIIAEETLKFMQWMKGLEAEPVITAIRKKADRVRAAEVAKTLAHLDGLTPDERKSVELLGNAIVNKLLHDPMMFLRAAARKEGKQADLALARKIFGLDRENGD